METLLFRNIVTLFILCSLLAFSSEITVVEDFSLASPTKPTTYKRVKYIKKKSQVTKYKKSTLVKKSKKIVKKTKPPKKIRYSKKNKKHSKINKRAPKLLIIIDDITTQRQLNFLKSLPFKVTPSIFPPSKMSMATPKLTKNLKHFMIHLPLQSDSKIMNKMHKTLFIYDSDKKIKQRVAEIRRLFPNARYVNNHTGSIFTANYKKSKVLVKELNSKGFIFLDSRTTQRSKIRRIKKELGLRYLKNDIFIDNIQNVDYTLNQLKKGISLAKRRGYAVVIGHPHSSTFKALNRLKPFLKGVRVVYIDEF